MCGIIGYTGNKNATEVVIEGLRKLEYRGYDSAGIAIPGKEGFFIYKQPGRVNNVFANFSTQKFDSKTDKSTGHKVYLGRRVLPKPYPAKNSKDSYKL